jgi:hypothetical protein
MNLSAIDIVQHFYALIWPTLRISAMFVAAPIYSLKSAFENFVGPGLGGHDLPHVPLACDRSIVR